MEKINVIGAGLAGCEAAKAISKAGIKVDLYEMKPQKKSPAHKSDLFAELVCSNSLKASRIDSSAGLLKEEARRLGSICMQAADISSVAAGGALAVDREKFSKFITDSILSDNNITVKCETVNSIPEDGISVIATGPLTDSDLADNIEKISDCGSLSFYDAAAPIVTKESIDMNKAFFASRYDREESGQGDYINCPMNKEEYEHFYSELISADIAPLKDFDKPFKVYEGCMPVEVLAKRGIDSIRFGPLKPVGLKDPRTGHRPWAAVQLRKENSKGSLYNLVGFQTNLKFPEQKRVFSLIPGLENAEFVRYGVMHRNTFINSPLLLDKNLSLKNNKNIFFGGQITGVEGYMESAVCGIVAGLNAVRYLKKEKPLVFPEFTMTGALLNHLFDQSVSDFQPMGANFGILPPLDEHIRDKKARYAALSARSLEWFDINIRGENNENSY